MTVEWPSLPEFKSLVRGLRMQDVHAAALRALAASSGAEVRQALAEDGGQRNGDVAFLPGGRRLVLTLT